MYTTRLRNVGGSVMLAVPPALLDLLQLGVGAAVEISVENDRLIVQSKRRPVSIHSTNYWHSATRSTPSSEEDRAWIDAKPVGKELL